MSEGNSCWDGGKPGVSNTFASAVVVRDYMLQCAGVDGPASTSMAEEMDTTLRLQVHRRLVLHEGLSTSACDSRNILSAPNPFRRHSITRTRSSTRLSSIDSETFELALINKTDTVCNLLLPFDRVLAAPGLLLSGPAIDAKEGVHLRLCATGTTARWRLQLRILQSCSTQGAGQSIAGDEEVASDETSKPQNHETELSFRDRCRDCTDQRWQHRQNLHALQTRPEEEPSQYTSAFRAACLEMADALPVGNGRLGAMVFGAPGFGSASAE